MSCSLAVVQFAGVKHCFLHVVDIGFKKNSETKLTSQLLVYEVSCKNGRKVFASLQGDAALGSECTVQISGLYANKLGIQDGETVMLKCRNESYTASRVDIEPLSIDDWEILERHATFVENHLLDQVRVVWPGQTLPVWVDKSVCIFLKVCQTDPQTEFGVLQNETEVVISPKSRPGAAKNQVPTSLSPPSNLSNGNISPRSEDLKDFVDGSRPPRRSPKTSNERSPRKFRKHQSDRYSSSLSETELLNNLKPQGSFRRQNSLTDSLWNKVSTWLQWSTNPHQVSNLPDLPKARTSERSDAYTLPWQNFVFRIQAMKFSASPEDFYSCETLKGAREDKRLSSSVRRGIPSPTRESQGDLNGTTPISALPCKQKSPKHETKDCGNIAHLFQPTTIFANIEDISKKLDSHGVKGHLPCVFYAKLKKLVPPKDKEEEEKRRKSEPQKDVSSPATTPSSPTPAKKEDVVDNLLCVVRVVGVDKRGLLAAEGWDDVARKLQDEQPLVHGHVLVPDVLRRLLKLDVTGRVWLHTVPLKPDKDIKKLFIYPLSILPKFATKDMIMKALVLYLEHCASDEHPLVVFQGVLLKFMMLPGLHVEVQLTFSDQELGPRDQVCLLTAGLLQQMTVSVMRDVKEVMLGVLSPMLPHRYVSDFDPQVPTVTLGDLGGIEYLSAKALQHLEMCLGTQPLSRHLLHHAHGLVNGMMLLTGPKGSGKSSLARALCRRLAELPTLAHVTVVECKPLRGKRVDNIQKGLEVVFDEAVWRQPAVILLDDLDVICGAPGGPELELSGEALYAARVAEVVQSLIRFEIKNNSRLAVIAVSQSRGSLHPLLMTSRGIHFIQETITITPPDKNGRMVLLEKIVANRRGLCLEEDMDLMAVAVKTEGYVARDFDKLVSRAMHAQYTSNRKKGVPETEGEVTLSQEDLEKALTGFQPASLRNVPLHTAGDLGWEDIGGLSSIKKTLVETLMWPSKYPQLFANCPLRLRSGLLLYGAPGTGKTLLAGVVAKECGLNFISIKGPELLSKYIGASEQAVRDLFTRAQSAKPCILFFDEFDSLAPRRGHDSTGVTDRVVNQLLTELDGVEGLEGVYVLGATSRPDLIDPALLRPGRLDKCLHCQLPSESERLEILKALTRKMHLGIDVELAFIAANTEFFSGADLKALLYNAQLEAIHEAAALISPPYFQDKETEVFLPPSVKTPSPPVARDQGPAVIQPHVKPAPVGENHITPDLLNSLENAVISSKQTEGQEPQEVPVVPAKSLPVHGSAVARAVLKKGASTERLRRLSKRGSQLKLKSFRSLQVAFIPRLEDGPQELTLEEEDKVLALVNELRRRDARRALQEQSECGEGDKAPGLVEVTQVNLESALERMHPSMSQQERDKFDRIYMDFTSSRRGDSTANLDSIGKRATLA